MSVRRWLAHLGRSRGAGSRRPVEASVDRRGDGRPDEWLARTESGAVAQAVLPARISRMVARLHTRGYAALYLHAGMSPAGTCWRYEIGVLGANGAWPGGAAIVTDSVGPVGSVAWSRVAAEPTTLAADFERTYGSALRPARADVTAYADWYARHLAELDAHEFPIFFADGPAPHAHWLAEAPGYRG
ncbi:hypothetical protein [Salinisphaera sp. Q1T1-3]|uniref:hypothetical protein n=1 Tax=Salinisphaera sp. Q1T1-3 TaxID=2321229 RepID=UPI000E770EB4|nr:hypothetical protein [Salinisphaera sp. Q1T1-3]RJS93242.1 hypothetical protein D3260_08130 [Salinisphaera sp. Q1T1-3]